MLGTTEDDSADESSGQASAEIGSKLDILIRLIATLGETITQQNIAIEQARVELKEIKVEQQDFGTLKAQFQEEVRTPSPSSTPTPHPSPPQSHGH